MFSKPAAILTPSVLMLIAIVGLSASSPSVASMPEPAGYQVLKQKCFQCHGEGSRLSQLDLRTRQFALAGGLHGPALVPGKPEQSRLFLMVNHQQKPQMPPTAPLSGPEIAALKTWIAQGAPYPEDAATTDSKWWAFRPIQAAAAADSAARSRSIDSFIDRGLASAGVSPNAAADRRTLLRRAYFDLHGLPPTPADIRAFNDDRTPMAWERTIQRLLASPRYGERYARHWLDLARFAESEGFKADETRPDAWRYRDYVIRSFNQDKPYDRFIQEQIAGDELWPDSPEALVATGFNRHWADESNARNIRLRRQEILNDITDTVGSVVLGLTVGCARCHDHKYDDFSHKDYYRLQAFFSAVQPRDDIPLVPRAAVTEWEAAKAAWEAATLPTRQALAELEAPYRAKLMKTKRMPFPAEVQRAIDTPAAERTPLQWQVYLKVKPQVTLSDEEVEKAIKGDDLVRWKELRKQLDEHKGLKPADLPRGLGVTDVGPKAPATHLLNGGVYDAPLDPLEPAFPAAIDSTQPDIKPPAGLNSTGRRSALARWLSSPENPLTARVIVNRIWQYHFGTGLVGTASDFGRAGEKPSHPELLDWLSAEFIKQGWSLKWLHRTIMSSQAYQRSSAWSREAAEVDPANRLLWRHSRRRLEGEAVRDSALLVSGSLNPAMGGPSIFPPLPDGVGTRGGWEETKDAHLQNRRSVYIFVRRNLRYPLFQAFDFPDTHEPCSRRSETNTPVQALMLLNGEEMMRAAAHFAGRITAENGSDESRIDRAYLLAYGRPADAEERRLAGEFLDTQSRIVRQRLAAGQEAVKPMGGSAGSPERDAAWVDFCHALLNSNEFLYVD